MLLNDGDDLVTMLAASAVINGLVDEGAGADQFTMTAGRINNAVHQGFGADNASMAGGEITQKILTQEDNDTFLWQGGFIGGLDMGSGDDDATFSGLTQTNLKQITIDGGAGSTSWSGTTPPATNVPAS